MSSWFDILLVRDLGLTRFWALVQPEWMQAFARRCRDGTLSTRFHGHFDLAARRFSLTPRGLNDNKATARRCPPREAARYRGRPFRVLSTAVALVCRERQITPPATVEFWCRALDFLYYQDSHAFWCFVDEETGGDLPKHPWCTPEQLVGYTSVQMVGELLHRYGHSVGAVTWTGDRVPYVEDLGLAAATVAGMDSALTLMLKHRRFTETEPGRFYDPPRLDGSLWRDLLTWTAGYFAVQRSNGRSMLPGCEPAVVLSMPNYPNLQALYPNDVLQYLSSIQTPS